MTSRESSEMYLETVYILSKESTHVRSVDVANYMSFARASVSRGLGLLKKEGLLTFDENGCISLTETGEKQARSIMEKHDILTGILIKLGVDEKTAVNDACRMEHVISNDTFDAIKKHFAVYCEK